MKDKWGHTLHINTCIVCRKEFLSVKNNRKFCSTKCIASGKNNGRWNGGKYMTSSGYILVYCPCHPHKSCRNHVLEHRLVMEKKLKRFLNIKEEIHHINGIKDDNRIKNLMLFKNSSEHQKFHTPKGCKVGSRK